MITNKKEGFTLAELLVVVGIIGILVAVSIPIFASNKTEAELATCQANRRALRAEMVVEYVADTYPDLASAFTAIYGAYKDEYVCPNKGDFTWESAGTEAGSVKCDYHDSGGGNPDGPGPNPDEPGGNVIPGTNIPLVDSYWPKQEDYKDMESWETITVKPGGIFSFGDKYYIVLNEIKGEVTKDKAIAGPSAFPWQAFEITGISVDFASNDGPIVNVNKGDACYQDGNWYVYTTNGGNAFKPNSGNNSDIYWLRVPS